MIKINQKYSEDAAVWHLNILTLIPNNNTITKISGLIKLSVDKQKL
uniref:Uncharacterized protein n=1 Tax=Rhizophora mucronata TaxID=61149 RepID=A0A2P2NHI4_RHIMU